MVNSRPGKQGRKINTWKLIYYFIAEQTFHEETMELNIFNTAFMIYFISALWMDIGMLSETCSNWTLSNGYLYNEGLVTVFYNGTWVNICADSLTKDDQQHICKAALDTTVQGATLNYSSNVFKAVQQKISISYGVCGNSPVTKNDRREICEVASLCCHFAEKDTCSLNWKDTVTTYPEYLKSRETTETLHYLTYDQLFNITNYTGEDIRMSWTRSALQENECVRNSSLTENSTDQTVTNCSKKCPVTSDLSFILLTDDNKTCCLDSNSNQYFDTTDCSIRRLSVLDGPPESGVVMKYCLAAEVKRRSLFVSIENCEDIFQPFRLSYQISTTTKSATRGNTSISTQQNDGSYSKTSERTTLTAGSSTQKDKQTSIPDEPDSISSTVPIVLAACVSLFVSLCVVVVVVIVWKVRKRNPKFEHQRPNSVTNRTYSIQLQHDDEEYTLISDMEIEHVPAEPYRPPVPDRGDNKMSDNKGGLSSAEIITLGEYSTPTDQIRPGYKISDTTDYCMTTYDDPSRLERQKVTETNFASTSGCDGQSEQSNKRDSKTNDMLSDRNPCNIQLSSSIHECKTADLKTDAHSCSSNTVFQSAYEMDKVNYKEPDQENDLIEKQLVSTPKQNQNIQLDEHFESINFPFTHSSKEASISFPEELEKNIPKNEKDDSDYEDPSIIDGNFATTCSSKRVLEEHVCLDCLKPEHLKKLGIKIISEEMYEKHGDLYRRLSEPPSARHCYYNTESFLKGKVSKQDPSPENHYNLSEHEHDTISELKVLRRKKPTGSTKRCSVCNTVYDRLGIANINDWEKCTDNVYDRFGDFKHFKHRQQLSGKRINST